ARPSRANWMAAPTHRLPRPRDVVVWRWRAARYLPTTQYVATRCGMCIEGRAAGLGMARRLQSERWGPHVRPPNSRTEASLGLEIPRLARGRSDRPGPHRVAPRGVGAPRRVVPPHVQPRLGEQPRRAAQQQVRRGLAVVARPARALGFDQGAQPR